MTPFEYVAVLISIIVGLALTQVLRGVGRMLTDADGPKPYWVHLVLTLYFFVYTTMFWWWEFQLSASEWSLATYYVLIIYATLLFVASLIVQPGTLHGVDSYKDYYYLKRNLIYGVWIAVILWDFVDTLAKGTGHIIDLGAMYATSQSATIIGSIIAIRTRNERFHQIFAIMLIISFAASMGQLHYVIS